MTTQAPQNPFAVLAQVLPRARSEQELVDLAAQIAPPPAPEFSPGRPEFPQSGVARLQQPPLGVGAMLANQSPGGFVPPITAGENRTRLGQVLMGG